MSICAFAIHPLNAWNSTERIDQEALFVNDSQCVCSGRSMQPRDSSALTECLVNQAIYVLKCGVGSKSGAQLHQSSALMERGTGLCRMHLPCHHAAIRRSCGSWSQTLPPEAAEVQVQRTVSNAGRREAGLESREPS